MVDWVFFDGRFFGYGIKKAGLVEPADCFGLLDVSRCRFLGCRASKSF